MLSLLKRPVTWRTTVKHAPQSGFSTLRNNFYREPYALEPREVALERAAHLGELCHRRWTPAIPQSSGVVLCQVYPVFCNLCNGDAALPQQKF
jgi:hypothetical protein